MGFYIHIAISSPKCEDLQTKSL